MRGLTLALRILAAAFIAVAVLHFIFGLGADAMLGVPVSIQTAAEPSADSQNRFYGISFSLLGIALLIGSSDLQRYRPMVLATLGVLFAAGLARTLSWVLHGPPAPALILILLADLLIPPLFYFWLRRAMQQ